VNSKVNEALAHPFPSSQPRCERWARRARLHPPFGGPFPLPVIFEGFALAITSAQVLATFSWRARPRGISVPTQQQITHSKLGFQQQFDRRGILSDDKKALIAEARRRGLVPGDGAAAEGARAALAINKALLRMDEARTLRDRGARGGKIAHGNEVTRLAAVGAPSV